MMWVSSADENKYQNISVEPSIKNYVNTIQLFVNGRLRSSVLMQVWMNCQVLPEQMWQSSLVELHYHYRADVAKFASLTPLSLQSRCGNVRYSNSNIITDFGYSFITNCRFENDTCRQRIKILKKRTNLRGLSPRAKYTDRETAASRRS
jgi:hypothetical protein